MFGTRSNPERDSRFRPRTITRGSVSTSDWATGSRYTPLRDRRSADEGDARGERVGVISMPEVPEIPSPLPDREVTVTYPSASPEAYLRWLAYFREVEASMMEHP